MLGAITITQKLLICFPYGDDFLIAVISTSAKVDKSSLVVTRGGTNRMTFPCVQFDSTP